MSLFCLILAQADSSSITLGSWREFGCRDDANAWRKSIKEADKHKIFYCQSTSDMLIHRALPHIK